MERLCQFSFCFLLIVHVIFGKELKVEYYEKLINDALAQSKTYKLRQNNQDFFYGSDNNKTQEYGVFDFIVVGAGSSGSIIASRLSEIENFSVLLLEAGDWDDDLTKIPYMANVLQLSDRNWGYYTTPQRNACFGWKYNRCAYPRGKVLGGSGTINALTYARGNQDDFNNWESMGNPGWSFEDVLPYFKTLENFDSENIDLNYRGFGGPLTDTYVIPKENFDLIEKAHSEIGVHYIDDFNAKSQIGVSRVQKNILHGKRVSGATAYVRPALNRRNFNVTVRAYVTKILIEKSSKAATGVKFVKDGQTYIARANKEVIISGGGANSPQLLMLSGIGPKDDLKKLGIPVVQNTPVGKHMKEHNVFRIYFSTNYTVKTETIHDALKEFLEGRGVLTNYENGVGLTFVNSRNSSSSKPNIEVVSYNPTPIKESIPAQSNYRKEIQQYMKNVDRHKNFYVELFLYHPKSVGTLKLKSKNAKDFPLIDTGMFTHPDDMNEYYEGIQFVERLFSTSIAKKHNVELINFDFCNKHRKQSKQYWFCAMRNLVTAGWHISTTVKMGPRSDPFAVVDNELKVYGVNRLRVADCSIFPTTISGHNNAVAFMIGEKAADMIRKTWIK